MSRVEPNRNVYVGHRYVPKIFGEWDKQNEYEGLSIVTHQGASYTSKKRVPVGIDILNEEFWAITGNYDAQVEYYREELKNLKKQTAEDLELLDDKIERTDIQVEYFGTVGNGETDDTNAIKKALDFGYENGVRVSANKDYLITENINGFMGNDNNIKNVIIGDGSITRNGQTFYFRPKGDQTNVIYIGSGGNRLNDGLTREHPVTLPTALEYLASLGDIVSDGHLVLRFIGEYTGIGFRNFKLPYFKNPLVFEGERDTEGNITSIINGVNNYDAYFIRADTGSTFEKFFEIRDLKFINFNKETSSAGAMAFWDNVDVFIHDCESENNSRFAWIRNGRLRALRNQHSGGHSGITVQYHTSFNIEDNVIHNVSSQGVNIGRSSAGHVARNDFKGNNINIEATQSSRLRTIENTHHDWGYRGVNLYLNATWEGIENEVIEYNFPREKPFYEVFYGSSIPVTERRTPLNRHLYDFPQSFFTISEPGVHNLNANGFQSPLRVPDVMLKRETSHVKIQLVIHSTQHATDPGIEFNIKLGQSSDPERSFVTIPVKSATRIVGEIEIDLYARKTSQTNYCIAKYHDGETQQVFYTTYGTANLFNKGTEISITNTLIEHIKGSFNVLGIITEISQ